MKNSLSCAALFAAAMLLAPAVLADNPQLYKWTDAQGVMHYSDQPPKQPAADLKTSDIPVFPAVDQAKIDKEQAALLAQVVAMQRLAQVQATAQAESEAAAEQLAELQAQSVVPVTDDSYSHSPIYMDSAFVPRAYRANLYLPHRPSGRSVTQRPVSSSQPAMPVLRKP
jgi:hypothetical protein